MRMLFSFLAIIAILVGSLGTWYLATAPALYNSCGGQTQLDAPAVVCESTYMANPPIWLFVSILAIGIVGLVLNLSIKSSKLVH